MVVPDGDTAHLAMVGIGCRLEVNTTGSNKHSPSPNPATARFLECRTPASACASGRTLAPAASRSSRLAAQPSPARCATLSAHPSSTSASTVGPAPEIDRGDAVGPQPVHQRRALRHRRGAVLLVQPVLGGGSSSSGRLVRASTSRAARPALAAASTCGTVRGSRPRAVSVSDRLGRERKPPERWHRQGSILIARRGSGLHPGEREAAEQTGGDVVGVALDLGGELEQRGVVEPARRRLWSRRARRRCRRRWRPRRSRGPGRAGCGWRRRPRGRAAARPAGRRRCAGSVRAGGSRRAAASSAPSPAMSMCSPESATRTTTSSYSPRARPRASKPGPRLALVAGTRTRTAAARNAGPAIAR